MDGVFLAKRPLRRKGRDDRSVIRGFFSLSLVSINNTILGKFCHRRSSQNKIYSQPVISGKSQLPIIPPRKLAVFFMMKAKNIFISHLCYLFQRFFFGIRKKYFSA